MTIVYFEQRYNAKWLRIGGKVNKICIYFEQETCIFKTQIDYDIYIYNIMNNIFSLTYLFEHFNLEIIVYKYR